MVSPPLSLDHGFKTGNIIFKKYDPIHHLFYPFHKIKIGEELKRIRKVPSLCFNCNHN
ncbi:hypothetical protein QY95_03612 [Bacillus thermotolerans]|uniref:Uncharacterized protein n=1 Tax=Bacillus thermotolerans TaxID=1221996 RepID=A0A0F5HP21_BACTR|nr:hypothetical protein QY95_03612 [Bacillus thermotolerans]